MKSIAKFGIPAQALAIVATTMGCESTDPMVGDFICTFFSYEGVTSVCPYTEVTEENGYTYEAYSATTMTVREDASGVFTQVFELVVDGTLDPDYSYATDYPLTGTVITEGEWEISIPTFYALTMECSATVADMTCYGTDVDGAAWEFNFEPVDGDVIL